MKRYPDLASLDAAAALPSAIDPPPRICIATPDITGLVRNGGIGTSFFHTAKVLAARGCQVTVLFCNRVFGTDAQGVQRAIADFARDGVRLELLLDGETQESLRQFFPEDMAIPFLTYRWLKRRADSFDLVLFPEWRGVGFYTLMAKRAGIAFPHTEFWVQTHSSSLWHALHNHNTDYDPNALRLFQLERSSVELADTVVSPTHYLLDWKERHGFQVPPRTCVQPYIIAYDDVPETPPQKQAIDEFVFFGRLEKRKGMHHFCQAVRKLCDDRPEAVRDRLKVTFLGKCADVDGEYTIDYLMRMLKDLPIHVSVLTTLDFAEAVEYLRQPGRAAFICSVADNSPLTVIECMHHGIPFLATNVGGIPELIRESDHAETLFAPDPTDLKDAMARVLAGGLASVRPRVSQADNIPVWLDAVAAATARARAATSAAPAAAGGSGGPEVTVCITHFNRKALLEKTIEGLEAQTFKDFEVIVVDDGSTDSAAVRYLDRLERGVATRLACRVLRQPNRFVGAARNVAIRAARGRYIVIMDDDNYAAPQQLELFVKAMRAGYFDAVTCAAISFASTSDPGDPAGVQHLYLPLGTGVSANVFGNFFGDANAIYRRDALLEIGGFTEDYGISWEDYELFMRLAVAGYRLGVVPEPLMWLRATPGSVSRSGSMIPNYYRALRPLLPALDWRRFGDAVLVAAGTVLQKLHNTDTRSGGTLRSLLAQAAYTVTGVRSALTRVDAAGGNELGLQMLFDNGMHSGNAGILLVDWASRMAVLGRGDEATAVLGRSASEGNPHAELAQAFLAAIATDHWDDVSGRLERLVAGRHATPDACLMLARLLFRQGRVSAAIVHAASAFDRQEAEYLTHATDVQRGVALGHLRSGLDHYIAHGRHERRPFDYVAPQPFLLAADDYEEVDRYNARLDEAMSQPEPDWAVLNQLLAECLGGRISLELCSLAKAITAAVERDYLAANPDVADAVRTGEYRTGLEHYAIHGRQESRPCTIDRLDAARMTAVMTAATDRASSFARPSAPLPTLVSDRNPLHDSLLTIIAEISAPPTGAGRAASRPVSRSIRR